MMNDIKWFWTAGNAVSTLNQLYMARLASSIMNANITNNKVCESSPDTIIRIDPDSITYPAYELKLEIKN